MIQIRYRQRVAAAVAIVALCLLALPVTAGAAPSENSQGGEAGRSGAAGPHAESADAGADSGVQAAAASGPTQVCDGDSGGHSDSGSGANTDGDGNEYHNTCPAGPSQNGSGDGTATGRPCMGCVGQADDKNPPGQASNGGDANHGYECDPKGDPNGGNNGIGKGNPAHTGCAPPENPPGEQVPPGTPPGGPGTTSNPPTVLAAVSANAAVPSARVLGIVINAPRDAEVAGVVLARTGAPIETLFQTGVLAVLTGALLLALSGLHLRRRHPVPLEL